ncbi:MAG: MBL fold metallo-hydrolase [Rhodospirillaceae bacterium]|jgi:ribonuclease J|nr:MBL fold metallo-hydrolase [Rhodospirillaceae bacterium]
MRFRIHHGAAEIGGNCIEIQAERKSIVLDLGLPLEAAGADKNLLPPIPGLLDGDNPDLLGVVVSHPHGDHHGLLASADPSIQVYMGDGARRLLEAVAPFISANSFPQLVTAYRNRETFTVGPFHITPFLMDHSAFDAYALLVEADGRRLLYSGDFRAHGRKAWAFDAFLSDPPTNVDALLMEGTLLGREGDTGPTSEEALEASIVDSIRNTDGLVLACFSPQNIDRFVTFYKAALRSNRQFIADVYTATILNALALPTLPAPSSASSSMRVYLPKRQKHRIVRTQRFDLVEPYRQLRIFPSDISARPERWVMMFRSSMIEDLDELDCLAGGLLIYSLWPGYLERGQTDLRSWCADKGMAFEVQHTSGHAFVDDLKRFVDAVAARKVVPIHTRQPKAYQGLFANVEVHPNGVWADV